MKTIDMIGKKVGGLTVISKAPSDKGAAWNCLCDCGNEKVVKGGALRSEHGIKSCGCLVKEHLASIQKKGSEAGKHKGGEAYSNKYKGTSFTREGSTPGLNLYYRLYRKGADKRGLDYLLSFENFVAITSSDCHYCGSSPKPREVAEGKRRYAVVANGVDRMDNNKGYTPDNCTPCCPICNRAKRDMSYGDFVEWLSVVASFHCSGKFSVI